MVTLILTGLCIVALLCLVLGTTTAQGSISAAVNEILATTTNGVPQPSIQQVDSKAISYAQGVGLNQADGLYFAVLTIAVSGNQALNFGNGSLNDILGNALTLVRFKAIYVRLLTAADTVLGVTGNACSAVNYSGANGSGGFTTGTTPARRVKNGGFDACGDPSAAGVTVGLTLTVTNEDATNIAYVVVAVQGGKS